MTELFNGVYEIALAVKDMEATAKKFADVFDKELDPVSGSPDDGLELRHTGIWFGDVRLAILEDTSGTGPTARLIEKRGEGLSEICMRTPDLDAAIAHLKAKGVRLVSDEPIVFEDYPWKDEVYSKVRIVFIHPSALNGLQVELQEWTK
jgi:methylmalonyl-CoA/ethylmalonyl-CoA epimerase